MPESTLSLTKLHYQQQVGIFLGWGGGSAYGDEAWTTDKQNKIDFDVASGLRRFYYCGFDWSFLKPYASLIFTSGATTLALPDDFGGMEGRIAISDGSSGVYLPLDLYPPGKVQQAYSESPTQTGRPRLASLRALKETAPNHGQRQEMFLFPTADADYTLTFAYYITPDYLLDTRMPYAYGGSEHSETILEGCLAVAEERRDSRKGVHNLAFENLLQASIKMDRRKRPQSMGYNGDNSDAIDRLVPARGQSWTPVTINGVEYT